MIRDPTPQTLPPLSPKEQAGIANAIIQDFYGTNATATVLREIEARIQGSLGVAARATADDGRLVVRVFTDPPFDVVDKIVQGPAGSADMEAQAQEILDGYVGHQRGEPLMREIEQAIQAKLGVPASAAYCDQEIVVGIQCAPAFWVMAGTNEPADISDQGEPEQEGQG